ncbi:capsid protein [robinz virus RP_212]|nr:capsid protein [robinz virus RP_212]
MRFRRGRRRRHRKSFNQKVGRALLKFAETKRLVDSVAESVFTAGNGTTRNLYIANPVAQLTQSTGGNDILGNSFWIKALWLRGRISLDQTTNSLRVRVLLIKSRQFADLSAGFTAYTNTTTISTNPAQTAADGETNVRIFETSDAEEAAQPSAPYVGNATGIDITDKDLVHVVGGREFFLSTQHLLNFQTVDVYVPINQKFTLYSEFGNDAVDQIRTVDGYNYYWILQVFSNSNANNILVAQDILGTFDIITYHKEI